ncbi:MAG: hypothetical protein IPN38_14060 [Flavobacteriales bacterium]|nr:hypothetical protein [Flavobacteriales bacterium]
MITHIEACIPEGGEDGTPYGAQSRILQGLHQLFHGAAHFHLVEHFGDALLHLLLRGLR